MINEYHPDFFITPFIHYAFLYLISVVVLFSRRAIFFGLAKDLTLCRLAPNSNAFSRYSIAWHGAKKKSAPPDKPLPAILTVYHTFGY